MGKCHDKIISLSIGWRTLRKPQKCYVI